MVCDIVAILRNTTDFYLLVYMARFAVVVHFVLGLNPGPLDSSVLIYCI